MAEENTDGTVDQQTPPEGAETPPGDTATPPADEGVPPTDGTPDEGAELAPESYSDFEMPEGMEANEELLELASPIFKKANLTQSQAQEVVNGYAKIRQEEAQQASNEFKTQVSDWEAQTRNDKEIGGDDFDKNLGIAKQALDQFFGEAVSEILADSGLGSHPEMVKGFYRIGKLLQEDNPQSAAAGASGKTNIVDKLYGKSS